MGNFLNNREFWLWVDLSIAMILMVFVAVDLLAGTVTATTAVTAVVASHSLLSMRLSSIEERV